MSKAGLPWYKRLWFWFLKTIGREDVQKIIVSIVKTVIKKQFAGKLTSWRDGLEAHRLAMNELKRRVGDQAAENLEYDVATQIDRLGAGDTFVAKMVRTDGGQGAARG